MFISSGSIQSGSNNSVSNNNNSNNNSNSDHNNSMYNDDDTNISKNEIVLNNNKDQSIKNKITLNAVIPAAEVSANHIQEASEIASVSPNSNIVFFTLFTISLCGLLQIFVSFGPQCCDFTDAQEFLTDIANQEEYTNILNKGVEVKGYHQYHLLDDDFKKNADLLTKKFFSHESGSLFRNNR